MSLAATLESRLAALAPVALEIRDDSAQHVGHAGASAWRGRPSCNDFSIGIELEGADDRPYTGAQYRMLSRLVRALAARYGIREVVGHSDVAPGRKTDPGSRFDWRRVPHLAGPRR